MKTKIRVIGHIDHGKITLANKIMKTKIGVIGHIDHEKTTLAYSIIKVLNETKKEVEEIQEILEEEQSVKTTKTIMEIIEEQKSFQIKNTLMDFEEFKVVKCGKEKRRERRTKERKLNKYVYYNVRRSDTSY